MTLATEILSVTKYNSTDVANAVTEATSYCLMHGVTDDEIIKSAAIWLLDRLKLESKQLSDPTVTIPPFDNLHKLIKSLKGEDVSVSTRLVTSYKSPSSKGKNPFDSY